MIKNIFGIDHGNGNMKTANTVFPCGFTKQQIKPAGIFSQDVIYFKGNYYLLNANRFPYSLDKTKDENCLILTLFAIAKEIKAQYFAEHPDHTWKDFGGYIGKDIILAAGLPPAHFEKQYMTFMRYFEDASRYGIEFTYNDKPFYFYIKSVKLYPQDYAAAVIYKEDLIKKYRKTYCIDIGDGTVDLLGLTEGMPDKNEMASKELGMAKLREKIIDDVINSYAYTLDGATIEDVLSPSQDTVLDFEIEEMIRSKTADWAKQIVSQLHLKVPDFRIAPTIFTGGGAGMLKPYLEKNEMFGRVEFIEDIRANAVAYETIAAMEAGVAE